MLDLLITGSPFSAFRFHETANHFIGVDGDWRLRNEQ